MTTPTPPPPDDERVDFRLRLRRALKLRIARYAATHYAKDAAGWERSLSLNAAAEQLLEAALDAAEKEAPTAS
jgi:hypothetical protein